MNSNLSIRFAGKKDIEAIGLLAQQIWPVAYEDILSAEQLDYMMKLFYSPESLMGQMEEQSQHFLMLEDHAKPAGFASYSHLPVKGIYKLHKIYVLPGNQGQGLGKILLEFIIKQIRLEGAIALRLNVNRYNKARYFYEKLGFAVIGEEDIDIGNNYFMNDYVMEKQLGGAP